MVEVNKIGIFLSIVLLSILALNTANAADLSVTVKTINGVAQAGDVLTYQVTFYNLEDQPVDLSVNMLAFKETTFSPTSFTIPAKSSITVNLSINVVQSDADVYGTAEGKTSYQQLLVFDKDGAQLGYNVLIPIKIINKKAPSVWSAVKYDNVYVVPSTVNPKDTFSIKFTISNPITAATVDATLVSGELLFDVPSRLIIPKGTNEITLSDLKIPDTSRPGQYGMSLKLVFLDATLDIPVTLNVGEFGACVIKEDVKSGVLGKVYIASVSVDGNVAKTCSVSTRLFGIERNLVAGMSDNHVYSGKDVTWQMTVQPGAPVQVSYSISYLPIIAIPFVIIALAIAFWYLTRKVEMTKELVDYRRHPGFMDLKIQLKVKNLSNEPMNNVKLVEPLPAFAKEVREYGTIPGSITVHKGGKGIKWELDHLKPKEERIFSYKIRTSVEVIGRMTFPSAVLKYTDAKGQTAEEASNVLAVEVE